MLMMGAAFTGAMSIGIILSNKIVVPDAAIREYNEKYGKYLPKSAKRLELPLVVDEDAMYLQAMKACSKPRK
mgnify:CR=1 FL=1